MKSSLRSKNSGSLPAGTGANPVFSSKFKKFKKLQKLDREISKLDVQIAKNRLFLFLNPQLKKNIEKNIIKRRKLDLERKATRSKNLQN